MPYSKPFLFGLPIFIIAILIRCPATILMLESKYGNKIFNAIHSVICEYDASFCLGMQDSSVQLRIVNRGEFPNTIRTKIGFVLVL